AFPRFPEGCRKDPLHGSFYGQVPQGRSAGVFQGRSSTVTTGHHVDILSASVFRGPAWYLPRQGNVMSQSLTSILVHLIYSTKNREPWLTPATGPELYAYQGSVFKAMHSPAIVINGTADHVHALFLLGGRWRCATWSRR